MGKRLPVLVLVCLRRLKNWLWNWGTVSNLAVHGFGAGVNMKSQNITDENIADVEAYGEGGNIDIKFVPDNGNDYIDELERRASPDFGNIENAQHVKGQFGNSDSVDGKYAEENFSSALKEALVAFEALQKYWHQYRTADVNNSLDKI
uniref:Uncharacterized protein n=1 Tax=Glossina pallidipes TaxID=7398 RepID=A0A1A9Z349_GLOPL